MVSPHLLFHFYSVPLCAHSIYVMKKDKPSGSDAFSIYSRDIQPVYSLRRAIPPFIILILGVVGLYLMTYFTIPVQEDNEYGVTGFLRRNGLSSDLNLQGIWAHMLHLWNDCNGRLIDKLPVPVLALMPRWLFSLVNAVVYVLLYAGACKIIALAIGGQWRGKALKTSVVGFMATYPWLASAFVLLMALFFPWDSTMMLVSYQLGYVWTSCVVVWLVYYFCNRDLIVDGSIWLFVPVLVLTVIAGTLHELIPCVLCCAFIVPAIWSDSRRAVFRRLLIVVALFAGFEILSHMPGHMRRVGYTVIEFDWRALFPTCKGLMPGPSVMPGVIYLLTLAVFALWSIPVVSFRTVWRRLGEWLRPWRERSGLWMVTAVTLGGFVASAGVMSMFGSTRIMSFGIVLPFIGGLALLGRWPGGLPRWFGILIKSALTAIGLCAVGVWSVSIALEREINRRFYVLEPRMIEAGHQATVYFDLPRIWHREYLSPNPYPWMMVIPMNHRMNMTYFNPLAEPYEVQIVPYELFEMERDADYADILTSDDLPDGYEWINRQLGILRYRNSYLFTNPDNLALELRVIDGMRYFCISGALNFDATFADGGSRRAYFEIAEFITPRTHSKAYWLDPALDSELMVYSTIVSADDLVVRGPFCIAIDSGSYGHFDFFPNESVYHTKVLKKNP